MFKRLLLITFFTGLLQAQVAPTLQNLTHSLEKLSSTVINQNHNPSSKVVQDPTTTKSYKIALEVQVDNPTAFELNLGKKNSITQGQWIEFMEVINNFEKTTSLAYIKAELGSLVDRLASTFTLKDNKVQFIKLFIINKDIFIEFGLEKLPKQRFDFIQGYIKRDEGGILNETQLKLFEISSLTLENKAALEAVLSSLPRTIGNKIRARIVDVEQNKEIDVIQISQA